MTTSSLKGTITALVTPFKNGALDLPAFKTLVQQQINAGIDGILVLGSTGEVPTLTDEESHLLIETAVQITRSNTHLMVNVSSSATHEAIRRAKQASSMGADSLLLAMPAYNKPMQEGLYAHCISVAESSDIPIVLYNHPPRTGVDLSVATLKRLCNHPNIIGIKEASGNFSKALDILAEVPECLLFSGNDNFALPMTLLGGAGVISTCSNVVPIQMKAMIDAALRSDMHSANSYQSMLHPLFKALECATNPVAIKALMHRLGMCSGEVRLPLTQIGKEHVDQMHEAYLAMEPLCQV